MKKDEQGNPVELSCYSCSSFRDDTQAIIEGKPECYTTPISDGTSRKCPIYANYGCFKSKVLIENGEEVHFKGCSAFDLSEGQDDEDVDCNEFVLDEQKLVACRSLCVGGDLCNTLSVQGNGVMCYSCEVTFNQMGQMLGWGDYSCFDDLSERHLQFCKEGSTACVTAFEADWRSTGQQTYTMRRGCGDESTEIGCLSATGPNGNFHAKRCTEKCDNSETIGCNDNNSIFNSFTQKRVSKCKTCSDHFEDPNTESDCAKGETSFPCPLYADAACFSSRASIQLESELSTFSSNTYHGCSSFRISQDSKTCFNVEKTDNDSGDMHIESICKESCSTDDCNDELTALPGDDGPLSHHFCYACSVTVNHLNQTVGNGDIACWYDPLQSDEIECPLGQNFCITDMEVDWIGKGDQYTTVRRSCAELPAPETCIASSLAIYQFKDCTSTCSNNLLSACNGNLASVSNMFEDQPAVISCYNCETHESDDTCGDLLGPDASRKTWPCPSYASAGCFTATSRHTEDGHEVDDTIRGCSTFIQEYQCATNTMRNLTDDTAVEFTTCKEACDDNNCNNQPAVIATSNQCYVCSVTVDQLGNTVGAGDSNCINGAIPINDTYIWDCGKESVCYTHMEVQWLPLGNQHMTFERRCGQATSAGTNQCMAGQSNAWMYKDCWESCEGDKCNDNMNIDRNFKPGNGQEPIHECYSCTLEEITSGNPVNDQYNCKDKPAEQTKRSCPTWAQSGCFVGDGVQKSDDDSDVVNIYRGCSSFYTEEATICSTLTIDTSVDTDPIRSRTSICKVTCHTADDCNTFRYPDWQPPGDNECPPEECVTTTLPVATTTPVDVSTTTAYISTTNEPITSTPISASSTSAGPDVSTTTSTTGPTTGSTTTAPSITTSTTDTSGTRSLYISTSLMMFVVLQYYLSC